MILNELQEIVVINRALDNEDSTVKWDASLTVLDRRR